MAPAISELDRDLRAMWKSAAAAREGGGGIYRAALSNLVTPLDPESHRQLASVLVEVTRRHPSRLILVEIGPEEDPRELTGEVAALCHLREAGGAVCSEQIILRGGAGAGGLVPSAVRSLLVGNLPLILLDLRGGPSLPWVDEIAERAELHLVDCGTVPNVASRRALWRKIGEDERGRMRDLAWACLTPWREIVADAFDATQLAGALREVREVTIEVGCEAPCSPGAPLLAGWIASRLGWSDPRGSGGETRFQTASGTALVRVTPGPDASGRDIHRARFRSEDPDRLDFLVTRGKGATAATVDVTAPFPGRYEVPFVERDLASVIVTAMHRHEPNPVLRESARAAAMISLPGDESAA
jgi:glucose-6-phosphate dehydrogenase assembly protein OpcA